MDLETPVAVYVPTEPASPSTAGIDAGSGIVGRPIGEGRVLVYYEGNRFNAANVVTFADRCNVAHGRFATAAPTVARALVPVDDVVRVGTFHREHGRVEVAGGRALVRLAKWLGLCHETSEADIIDSDKLAVELRTTGLTAAHRRRMESRSRSDAA